MDSHAPTLRPEDLLAHAEYLRALARRLVRDDASADDLVQEAWIEALRRRGGPIARLRPFLAGLLRNLARETNRGEQRRVRRERATAQPEAQAPSSDALERIEGFRELARHVAELDEPYRSTIVRLYFDGLTAEELAASEGVPSATVRSRHLRALQDLRARLDRHPGGRAGWIAAFAPERLAPRTRPLPRAPAPRMLAALGAGAAVLVAWLAWELVTETPGNTPDPVAVGDARSARPPADLPEPAGTGERAPAAAGGTATAPAAPLALLLTDAETRAPLPWFQVVASDPVGTSETLVSDARGRVRGQHRFPRARLALHLVDHPRLAAWRERPLPNRNLAWSIPFDHAAEGKEVELPLDVGPTYELALHGLGDPGQSQEIECVLHATAATLSTETHAPLRREGGSTWVRFSNEARVLPAAVPWFLEARAGNKTAWARIQEHAGRASGRIALEFAPSGSLAVRVRDARGPVTAVRLGLVPPTGSGARPLFWSGAGAERTAHGLATGRHELSASSPFHTHRAVAVEVLQGVTAEQELVLERLPAAGDVEGRVRCSGGALEFVDLVLRSGDGADELERQRIAFGGETEVAFTFPAVPDGAYVLEARAPTVQRWRPGRVTVRPPADALELVAELPERAFALVVRAEDARTGAPLDHFQCLLTIDPERADGRPGEVRHSPKSALIYGGIPDDAALAWTVAAEGYRPLRGDARALFVEGDHRALRARLEPGWGREIVVLDAATGAPVPAVQVKLDGRPSGRTDEDGCLRLELDAVPRLVELELGDRKARLTAAELEPAGIDRVRARLP